MVFLLRTEGKLRIEGRKGRKGRKGKPLDSSKKVHRTRRVQGTWSAKNNFLRGEFCASVRMTLYPFLVAMLLALR